MKKLLIIVDYQVDFAGENGILTAGEPARAIEPFLMERAGEYLAAGQDIVFTLDSHSRDTWASHPESGSFPIHCEKGTSGFNIYGRLGQYLGNSRVKTVEKTAYCPSFELLEEWVNSYDTIELMGLVTNICVLHTAVGLYTAKVNSGSMVRLILEERGCASFDPAAHTFAIEHMHGTLGMRP